MISPETLRIFPFFGFLEGDQFKRVAMNAEKISYSAGETIFEIDTDAKFLYLLMDGDIDLHYSVVDRLVSDKSKKFYVGQIDPGGPFGLSAIMAPYTYTATCSASKESSVIRVDAKNLLTMASENPRFGYAMMTKVAEIAFERLGMVRLELVAAR